MILKGIELVVNEKESKLAESDEPLTINGIEPIVEALEAFLNSNLEQQLLYARMMLSKSSGDIRIGLAQGNGSDVPITPSLVSLIVNNARVTLIQEVQSEEAE